MDPFNIAVPTPPATLSLSGTTISAPAYVPPGTAGTTRPATTNKSVKVLTNAEKWWISLLIGIIFFIFASPMAFGITNAVSQGLCLPATCCGNGATIFGLFFHSIVVILITRLLLQFVGTTVVF